MGKLRQGVTRECRRNVEMKYLLEKAIAFLVVVKSKALTLLSVMVAFFGVSQKALAVVPANVVTALGDSAVDTVTVAALVLMR